MSVRALLPFVPSAIIFALACAGWFKLRAETSHARQRLVELHESDEQPSSLRSLSLAWFQRKSSSSITWLSTSMMRRSPA